MRFALALGLGVALAGCNGGLDQKSATDVMTSALTGTASAQAQLKPLNGNANASFNGDIQNPAGSGSAHVDGTTTATANGWDVAFDIAFNHWTDLATNVTLDGSLHEDAQFTTMLPLVGSVKVSGSLAASGSVQAQVDFDLAVSYSPTQYSVVGHVGGASINASLNL